MARQTPSASLAGHFDGRIVSLPEIYVALVILVACNGDIGIGFLYHEACLQESFA